MNVHLNLCIKWYRSRSFHITHTHTHTRTHTHTTRCEVHVLLFIAFVLDEFEKRRAVYRIVYRTPVESSRIESNRTTQSSQVELFLCERKL